jgi:hypothetical protein
LRTLRTARIIHVAGNLLRALGCQFTEPIDDLAITATLLNETMQPVTTIASAFVAGNAQHIELADKVAEDGCAVARHWLAIHNFRKELPVVMALLFTDRILRGTGECRVLRAEATIATDYHLPTGSQGLNGAILFDSACPSIHISAPGPLVRMTCAEYGVEGICRCRVGAKANWRENNQSCQK